MECMLLFTLIIVFPLSIIIWAAMGAVVMIGLNDHAEKAWILLIGQSAFRTVAAFVLWPLTLITALMLQIHPRYRGVRAHRFNSTGQ